jgi:Spy/CpxP family protein refolding chaperone
MSKVHTPVAATLIALACGFSTFAIAQSPGHGMMHEAKREAHRSERHQNHLNEMKIFLQLQASQENAWNTFEAVMKTPMKRPTNHSVAEMEKLSTPERIDKMMAFKAERDSEITKRMEASKTFYATLTPAQQKVFDTQTQKFLNRGPMGHHVKMTP